MRTSPAPGGGPRYSIIPACAVTDPRFQGRDLQILGLIGRHTDRNGWCRLNQGKLAAAIAVSRTTVTRSIARLVDWGYLETRTHWRTDGGRAASSYRVRMDVDDVLAAPEIDIEDDPDPAEEAAVSGAENGPDAGETGTPPVHQVNTPLCTLGAHPPVHSGCTPLTTPILNDQKKPQRQKKAETPGEIGATDLPDDPPPGDGQGREADDEGAERRATAGDGAPEGEREADAEDRDGPDRSAAARKAAETKAFDRLVTDWPGGNSESQKRIRSAWDALSAQDKRDAVERAERYRVEAARAGRKRSRLGAYLEERRFVHVRMPAVRPAPADGGKPSARLPDDAVRAFLSHASARAVLEMAARDGLVQALAQDVAAWHRLTTVERYREKRDEWLPARDVRRERLTVDSPLNTALRAMADAMEEKAAIWQAFAFDVLGWSARDGPGDGGETAVAKRASG
ncbi:MarR family transcriptional regulator [Stappia sp. ES.058]|uniref:MarR family transcriptional regulator n=1 Tax=Stappia sp. ES.058 TaxID=1881061 RepID=UPI00087A73BE|nr:MarR family transcriptional regulator [Stappia sp. ES.058]SDT96881.1 MarR family protein [Stappia sp. ES.058]